MPDAWGNENGLIHGGCRRGKRLSVYRRWQSIVQRCYNPKNVSYHNYGGRGIGMYEPWRQSFNEFHEYIKSEFQLTDIPRNLEIDRKDNDKGYEPGNLRLSTKQVQANNRRTNRFVEACGVKMTIGDAARLHGLDKGTLHRRISNNEPDPFRPVEDVRIEYCGERISISELSRRTGVPRRRLNDRIKRQGLSVEEAISHPPQKGKRIHTLKQ